MANLLQHLRTSWQWVQHNGAWLLLLLVGAWTGAALYRRKTNQVNSVAAALAVERAKAQVTVLRAQRAALKPQDEAAANAILKLSAKITDQKKLIAELHSGKAWEEMRDDEVSRALREARL
jgi:hypothetical protein